MENGSVMIEIAWPRAGKWHFFYTDKDNLCFDYLAAFPRKLTLYSTAKITANLFVSLKSMDLLLDYRFRISVVSTNSNISI